MGHLQGCPFPSGLLYSHDRLLPWRSRIFDYAKEMSLPTFHVNPQKFAMTGRIWDSWILHQLMGCRDALVDRAKSDLLMQRCIPSLRESFELMRSHRLTLTFAVA